MVQDHLDAETRVGIDLTPTGFNAKAKSRALAAIDRLIGNSVDWINIPLERANVRKRNEISADTALTEAAVQKVIERMGVDEDFARVAIETHLDTIFRKQVNKAEVVREAVEQMKLKGPNTEANVASADTVSEEFMHRFETYAAEAGTERLREKWGKVLASEILKPGTFTLKAMRLVDELDGATAKLFENACRSRVGAVIPKAALDADFAYDERLKLVDAGLIAEPGAFGLMCKFSVSKFRSNGVEHPVWLFSTENHAISFPADANFPNGDALTQDEGSPQFPVYALTSAGQAIAAILPSNEAVTMERLWQSIKAQAPELEIDLKARVPHTTQFFSVKSVKPTPS